MGITQSSTMNNVTDIQPVATPSQITQDITSLEKVSAVQSVEETKYIEPQGTKIEVQPAEVTAADDVVKKTKKKKSKN
jgi:hypothetical protein